MKNYAYLTFLSTDLYIYYVLGLYESWLKTNSKYNFYCVITKDISESTKQILTQANISYLELDTTDLVEALNNCKNFTKSSAFKKATEKLKFFNLTQFDKCVYLDSDMIIYDNLDSLFNLPDFSAVEDTITDELEDKYEYFNGMSIFNGGLFVFTPSKEFYEKLLKEIPELPDIEEKWSSLYAIYDGYHDQSILAYYNQDWLKKPELHIPLIYNFAVKESNYIDYKDQLADIKVKHFINNKTNIILGKRIVLNDLIYEDWFNYINFINKTIKEKNIKLELLNLNLLIKASENKKKTINNWPLFLNLRGWKWKKK